jgi:4'-phosphopantetheinyl transferase
MTRVGLLLAAAGEVPADTGWLDHREREVLDGLRVPKRRDEFLLGRWTARRAGAAFLGGGVSGWAVVAATDGAPEAWAGGRRAPLSISISHRAGWAACAVGPPHLALGCDLELVEPRTAAFVDDFLTAREAAAVRAAPDRHLAANLVWSAKEAVLKGRRTGLRADSRSVEVDVDPAARPAGWSPFAAIDDRGSTWRGWWMAHADLVVTVASRPYAAEPFDLAAPQAGVGNDPPSGRSEVGDATTASTSSP